MTAATSAVSGVGEIASGQRYDVTDDAVLEDRSTDIELLKPLHSTQRPGQRGGDGFIRGAEDDSSRDHQTRPSLKSISYETFNPFSAKLGCNAGTCHGAAERQERLQTLAARYDPESDYQALINDLSGRRFKPRERDESLMLLKPSPKFPRRPAPLKPVRGNTTSSASGLPKERNLKTRPGPGAVQSKCCLWMSNSIGRSFAALLVLAHYPDGSVRRSRVRQFSASNNGAVAESEEGVVTGLRRVKPPVLVRYRGLLRDQVVTVGATGQATSDKRWPNTIHRPVRHMRS